jgi:hypothetical protein
MRARYNESLLQWIWENLEFDVNDLKTQDGQSLQILDPGRRNSGAGPDFLNACIIINDLKLYGSVEIHNREKEWFEHSHQQNPEFNSVILHVVLEGDHGTAITSDGHKPALLNVSRKLNRALYQLLNIKEQGALPCAGSVTHIHQRAFEIQVERAHKEYFTFKVDELMRGYDPTLPPSVAWRKALLLQLYSTLGIPANRNSMQLLVPDIIQQVNAASAGREEFVEQVMTLAFENKESQKYHWNFSGMRPGSQPKNRVRQAAILHYQFIHSEFDTYLKSGIESWDLLISSLPMSELPGHSRMEIIHKTVFLPAMYLLGDLFFVKNLCSAAYNSWKNEIVHLPKEVRRPFEESGFEIAKSVKKFGLAHQYKRFCKERNCHKCEVFKSVINP